MCSPEIMQAAATRGPVPPSSRPVPRLRAAGSRRHFSRIVDLTHPLPETFPSANGEQWLTLEDFLTFAADGINFKRWHLHEHLGTHMDAPIHFSEDGATVDEIPAAALVVPLAVIDLRERAAGNPDTQLTPGDIRAWEARHGPLPYGACVAVDAGWDRRATGPGHRNLDEAGTMHFPGVHEETALMLLETRDVSGIAVDTLSIDHGPSAAFPTHRAWLPAGRWVLENVANLGQVPPAGATLVVGAPTVVGATGGPCRVFALIDDAAQA